MAGDYEFSKKPHRMTSPPANKSKWLPGYEGVGCKLETDPLRIAILCREATWGSVFDFEITPEIIESTMKEIEGGKILGAAYEVPAMAFVMRGSRSTMDQLLRLRESAGAAHTTRDNDFRDFNIIVPNTIERLRMSDEQVASGVHTEKERERNELYYEVSELVAKQREIYGKLVDAGVPPQDARYVALPMGYQGDWVQVMNLRALVKECEQRLCNGLTQHESNYMVRLQRDLVVAKWPWMSDLLRSSCEKRRQCASLTMLFPPCGAFGTYQDHSTPRDRIHPYDEHPTVIAQDIYEADPTAYLYPPSQNDAMMFAEWDKERRLAEENGEGPFKYSLSISYQKGVED